MRKTISVLLPAVLLASCDLSPSEPANQSQTQRAFTILDGAHGDNAGFYFLPPLVHPPHYTGTFDGSQSPVVSVCVLSGDTCGATVASFSGSQIKVDLAEQAYKAKWKTKDEGLDPSKLYRIQVIVGATVLGYADLAVLDKGNQIKTVDKGQFVAAINGGVVQIRFRIETPTPTSGGWNNNAYVTFTQAAWGDPQASGGALLAAQFDAIYGVVPLTLGSMFPTGHALIFTTANAVQTFLPQSGAIGPIQGRFTDPVTSGAGVFGGDAVALFLNTQFSDAGHTPAPGGVRFGDLVLCGFARPSPWNGVVVRDFLFTISATLVNGRVLYLQTDEIAQMAANLNASFDNGVPSQFAHDHLVTGTCPGAWKQGDVTSYSQDNWGSTTDPAVTVLNAWDLVYPGGLEIGIIGAAGNSLYFTAPDRIVNYLPDAGFPMSLEDDYLEPTSSVSWLAGTTLALQMDVDFSDAGYLPATAGLRFGDLRICGVSSRAAIQGETVRALLGRANQMLGGSIPDYGGPYDAAELAELIDDVSAGFVSGAPSYWARLHLVSGTCP